LRLKKGSFEILSIYGQLILRKTRDGRAVPWCNFFMDLLRVR
jgi:hypothetical protein